MATEVSLKTLIETGAHFGHQVRRWNPKMREYIYGEKEGVHVFDLTKTKALLDEALAFLKKASGEGKLILIVGTKKQAKDMVKDTAGSAGIFYINERWLGGTFTNFEQIKRSLRRLDTLKSGLAKGEFLKRTKKERLLIDRDVQRLERFFSGIIGLERMPDILIIVDVKREHTALKEAVAAGVEVVAIVDSNTDPTGVNYPIPMNDDATKALEYVLGLFRDAILEGKGKKKEIHVDKKETGEKVKKEDKKTK